MSMLDLDPYNDLHVKANDLTDREGPTVFALARNEMFFLPSWLEHYRRLGARRFIVLDDASTDGTFEYLSRQPDVMVVGSHRRYGEKLELPDPTDPSGRKTELHPMAPLWRMMLAETWCLNGWAVQAALDEYLVLPEGMTLGPLFEELDGAEFDAVTGTLLDVYPATIGDLRAQTDQPHLDFAGDWYFDARVHRVPGGTRFLQVYAGSRARLVREFLEIRAMTPPGRLAERVRMWFRERKGKSPYKNLNNTTKYALMRWRKGATRTAHRTSLAVSLSHHLPVLHMKFTGDLYRRAQLAISEKSYHNASADYVRTSRMLAEMERREAAFLCPWSASIHTPDVFRDAGLIVGFDTDAHRAGP